MSKKYEITKIEYNQKMANKYAGAFLHTIAIESEAKRRDFVFENSKQFKVLQECAVGNIVELKIVKSGDFFNLAKEDDAILLVSKEKSVEDTPPQVQDIGVGAKPDTPIKSYSGYKEDPDKQAAIIRQNALTNATNLMIARWSGAGVVDAIVKDIIEVAIQFAKFTSGEDMTEYLAEEFMETSALVPPPKKRISKAEKETKEVPSGEFGE